MSGFGDGKFAFEAWSTPFANESVEVLDVSFSRTQPKNLGIRVGVTETASVYLVTFDYVSAFRVLDEHGLTEIWAKTAEQNGRPAQTTFRIRNGLWSKESVLSFVPSDGWSYVIATNWGCVEIATKSLPVIRHSAD